MHNKYQLPVGLSRETLISRYLHPLALLAATITLPLTTAAAPLTKDVSMISVTNSEGNSNGASSSGTPSSDKNLVAFLSSSTNLTGTATTGTQVFLRNRSGGSTSLISKTGSTPGNGDASAAKISNDGTRIVFATAATNFTGSPTALSSIYSALVSTGDLTHVSSGTTLGNSSTTSNIAPDISDDGTRITFLANKAFGACSDTSNVLISQSGTLSCISSETTFSSRTESEARISGDGTTVAIVAAAADTDSQIYTLAVATPGTVTRISELSGSAGNGSSNQISISQNGANIAFTSTATNLTSPSQANATKAVYLYRQGQTPEIRLVSKTSSGAKCDGESSSPVISKNGNYIAFLSKCRDLTTDNPSSTGVNQVFIYNVSTDAVTARASLKSSGAAINGNATAPLYIDDAGQVVFFSTDVSGVSPRPSDKNSSSDIFAYDSTCASNSDSSGGNDCTDECPFDSSKDADSGACGCGLSDSDTDSDGSPDCEDGCPSDPLKTTNQGFCGCGVAETDADGNGVVDCLDPTSSFVPKPAKFSPDPTRTSGVLTFPGSFVARSVTYEYQFIRDRVVVRSGTTKSRTQRIRPLGLGRFTLRYRVYTSAARSRWSTPVQINMRLYPKR